jgi:hypothetical protein
MVRSETTTGFGSSDYATYAWQIPLRATLDAIPGIATNTIKRDGKGTVSVALLGSRWFLPADVNPASLTLGNDDGVDTRSSVRCGAAPIFVGGRGGRPVAESESAPAEGRGASLLL